MKLIAAFIVALSLIQPAFAERLTDPLSITELDLLKVPSQRLIRLNDATTPLSAFEIGLEFSLLNEISSEPIYFLITSPGGLVTSGLEIIQAMLGSEAPVICIANDYVASMGAIIASFCPRLYVVKDTVFIFHPYQCRSLENPKMHVCRGNEYAGLLETLDKFVAKQLGIPVKEYLRLRSSAGMWVFDAEDAVGMGFASVLVDKVLIR